MLPIIDSRGLAALGDSLVISTDTEAELRTRDHWPIVTERDFYYVEQAVAPSRRLIRQPGNRKVQNYVATLY